MAASAPYPPAPPPAGYGRPPERRGSRRGALIGACAALVAVALAAAVIVVMAKRDGTAPSGPDPYAGAYPLVGAAAASPGITWQPTRPPAGPLKRFSGPATRVIGTMIDRRAGLSYAKLAAPWKPAPGVTHTGGIEWTVKTPFRWYAGAYSDLLDSDLVPATKGPGGLRAAAELDAAEWAKTFQGTLTPTAGQALRVSRRRAWLAGYRVHLPNSFDHIRERVLVVVVVNSGRSVPAVFEISVAKAKLLPDITTLVSSLRVIR